MVGARSALFLPLPRARPDRGRRGARRSFKQEEGVALPRPRHGAGARAARGLRRWSWPRPRPSLETAGACRASSRRRRRAARPGWHHVVAAGPPRRRARCPRCGWSTSGASGRRAAASCRRRCARRWTATLAAGAQSLLFLNRRGYAPLTCAAPAATASPARTARPGWWRIACAAGCCAIIAATAEPGPTIARAAARSGLVTPAARASSAWPRRCAELLPEARRRGHDQRHRRRRRAPPRRCVQAMETTRSTC